MSTDGEVHEKHYWDRLCTDLSQSLALSNVILMLKYVTQQFSECKKKDDKAG